MSCHRPLADGIAIDVRLTPKAARDAIDGIGLLSDGRAVLMIRVRAAPADNDANRTLLAVLASALDVRRSAVTITAGHHTRLKQVKVAGDPAALAGLVDAFPRLS
jgi:uncharacterized protein (TIGR00251 family)